MNNTENNATPEKGNYKNLITLIDTDINSDEKIFKLDISITGEQFKELCQDINYISSLNEFVPPVFTKKKFFGERNTGVRIEYHQNHLILGLLKESKFTPEKILAMALIVKGELTEYINSDYYRDGFNNDGLYKMHIATDAEVDEFLTK